MSQVPTRPTRSYTQLHDKVVRAYGRKWWLPFMVCGAIGGVLFGWWVTTLVPITPLERVATIFSMTAIGFSFSIVLPGVLELIGRDDRAEAHIERTIQLLHELNLDEAKLNVIQTRAQISSTQASLQSLLPLFLLPIGFSFLSSTGLSLLFGLFLIICLLAVALVLISVLDRATVDSIILHALAEYNLERQTQTVPPSLPDSPVNLVPTLGNGDSQLPQPIAPERA